VTAFSEVRCAQTRHWRADEPWTTPLRTPTTLRSVGKDRSVLWGIMATTNLSLRSEGMQDRAYLSIGVTNSSGAGLCGVPGEGDSKGIGAGICKILHPNFREYLFHALG
jgi:hypothetical protein